MKKRIKWTYEAEIDYVLEYEKGKWVIGFLDEEGNPFECPTTTDPKLIEKLEKFNFSPKRLRVTVEIDAELDEKGRQYPILIDVEPLTSPDLFF